MGAGAIASPVTDPTPKRNDGKPTLPDRVNVLLIGGGGREHALARAIKKSPRLGTLYITHPEHPGLAAMGTPVDVPVSRREIYRLQSFCDKKDIGLVVIGPEDPLAEGFADELAKRGDGGTRLVFGPGKEGARLEADKAWAKDLMRSALVPTADSRSFTNAESALEYVDTRREVPVVKASGLAKGKGVIVPSSLAEARDAVTRVMVKREFGDAGAKCIIEERLKGPEVSVFAITDGSTIMILPPFQDHKRLRDGDHGPNTGGMGAYGPAAVLDERGMDRVEHEILLPMVDTLRRENIRYRGVLYAGLMLTHGGPKVLEFNARFGDPECQPLMALLESDALELFWHTAAGTLDEAEATWSSKASVCVVLASEGYPEKPVTGVPIRGVEDADAMDGVTVDLAGVKRNADGDLITAGGRVLSVTAVSDDLGAARALAYKAAEKIGFKGMQLRTDIAEKALMVDA